MVRYEKDRDSEVMTNAIITMPTTSAYNIRCMQLEICDVIKEYNPEFLCGVKGTPYYWLLTLLEATLPTEEEYMVLENIRKINAESSPEDLQKWLDLNKNAIHVIHNAK